MFHLDESIHFHHPHHIRWIMWITLWISPFFKLFCLYSLWTNGLNCSQTYFYWSFLPSEGNNYYVLCTKTK